MHCHICDSDTDSLKFEQGTFTPCAVCEQAILECIQGYEDPDYVDLLEQEETETHVSNTEVGYAERGGNDCTHGEGVQPWS